MILIATVWLYWVPQETCHFWKVKSTQQGYLQLGYEKPWHEAAALTMGVAFASLKGQQLRWIIHIESWNHCNGWCLECQGSWLHAEPRKYRWQLLDREWRIFGKMPMMPGDGSTDGGFSGLQLPLAHILGRDLESGRWWKSASHVLGEKMQVNLWCLVLKAQRSSKSWKSLFKVCFFFCLIDLWLQVD